MPGGIGGRIGVRAAYADASRPHAERIEDLLERLTLDEKVALLHQHQPAIPRLDLPAFTTGTEVLHGVAWLGEATVFPQPIGLASAWDPTCCGASGRRSVTRRAPSCNAPAHRVA